MRCDRKVRSVSFFMICEQCLTPEFVSILIKQLGPVNHWRDRCPVSGVLFWNGAAAMLKHLRITMAQTQGHQASFWMGSPLKFNMVHLKISPWKRRFRKLESIILRFHGKKFGGGGIFFMAKTE